MATTILLVTLVGTTLKVTRLPRKGRVPRYHELNYSSRKEALRGFFYVAARLDAEERLHRSSVIEN